MQLEPLVFVGTCDLAGHVRGKGFPAAELPGRLLRGIGLTHSNIMMSAFGPIYSTPFGTEGDLMLVPDPDTRVEVAFDGGTAERFYLGDIRTTEGAEWECCPRAFLRRALAALRAETGLILHAAFEQEFVYTGVEDRAGAPYALDAYRRQGVFGEAFMAAIRQAGAEPDSFLPEYGPRQFEVTVAFRPGLRPADDAVVVREMARAVAHRLGHRAILAPMIEPRGIGNGTHIHFSLRDESGQPVMHDARRPFELSETAGRFAAGLVHHLPALCAITAPSAASYFRLTPNRWAPTWANLALRDRGAALRVCPVFGATPAEQPQQFHLEFRVADATASPYMALGALVWAGLDGIRQRITPPSPPPPGGFWAMSDAARAACGISKLPATLGEALDRLEQTEAAPAWLGETLYDAYLMLKRAELRALDGMSAEAICARYAEAY